MIPTSFHPYAYLSIVRNSDGTISRDSTRYPNTSPTSDPTCPVISKDVPINPSHNTWARVFVPRREAPEDSYSSSGGAPKLPLIVYFHGGGFIYCSAASTIYHHFCSNMAVHLSAVVVSVDYRLAPEHRLPGPYEDAVEALRWIRTDDWLGQFTDFSNCYVMGSSSGANIAYNAGLCAPVHHDLEPLKIRGLILHHPFFGGIQRTGSELKLENDQILHVYDAMWDLALPIGADRDHEYCNPAVDGGSPLLENINMEGLGWRVLVTVCDGDPLIDRAMEVVDVMDERGVEVVAHFGRGGGHLVELTEPAKAEALYLVIQNFILLR